MKYWLSFLMLALWSMPIIYGQGDLTMGKAGWTLIYNNDISEAKKSFERVLTKDSTDYEALMGLMFVYEIENNDYFYNKHLNTLMNHHADDALLRLFTYRFEGDDDQYINNQSLSETARILPRLRKSDGLMDERKFKESAALRKEVLGDLTWEVLGPFDNESGIGYVKEFDPEKNVASDASYTNIDDLTLSWVPIKYPSFWGKVDYEDYLPSRAGGNTYYTRCRFETSEAQDFQLRLSRNTPAKVWVNGTLVFGNDENVAFNRDNEIIEITNAPAGSYEVLIKSAPLPKAYTSVNFLDFDGTSSSSSWSGGDSYGFYGGGDYEVGPEFSLRVTDLSGKPLVVGNFNKNNLKDDWEATLKNEALLTAQFDGDEPWMPWLYLLSVVYSGDNVAVEPLLLDQYLENSDKIFWKYLMAKLYAVNGKQEKAYQVLSNIDLEKNPIYDLRIEDLQEVDADTDKELYLEKLNEILAVYPTNGRLLMQKAEFLENKISKDTMKAFVRQIIADYPFYTNDFEYMLDEEEDEGPMNDETRKKEQKNRLKRMKERFNTYDYIASARYYLAEKELEKALEMYDQLIAVRPDVPRYRLNKTDALMEEKEFKQAKKLLEKYHQDYPYNTAVLENLGSVSEELKEEEQALGYYEKALAIRGGNNQGWSGNDLSEKIERLAKPANLLKMCEELAFEDVMNDKKWTEQYAEEDAVILLYTKDMVYDKNRELTVRQKFLVKIQNEAGVRQWTEASLGFLGNLQMVKLIKPDGAEVSPERSWGQVVFKDLAPGDIIQAVGTAEQKPQEVIDGAWTHLSYFGWENTAIYKTKIELVIPQEQYFDYECHKVPCETTKSEIGDYYSYKWSISDMPKPKYEPGVPDQLAFWPYIMFSTMKDWSGFVEWYQAKTYKIPEYSYELDEILAEAVTDEMTDREKVASLYNYITTDITYSYVPFLQNNYVPQKPGQICSSKIGDCKDVSSLMITLLRKIDIDAKYVLVRTTQMAHDKLLPSNTFNHVIVGYHIEGGPMEFMDLTTDYYPYYTIHEYDSDAWALEIVDGVTDIFQLPNDLLNPNKNNLTITTDAYVKEDRTLEATSSFEGNGIIAAWFREYFNNTPKAEHTTLFSSWLATSVDNAVVSDLSFEQVKEIDPPLTGTWKYKANNFSDKVSRFRILSIPLMFSLNPNEYTTEETRFSSLNLKDFDMLSENEQIINLNLPAGYSPLELPEDVMIKSDFGTYALSFTYREGGMQIKRKQHFSKKIISVEDYPAFKAFYNQMVEADDTKFIIQQN